MRQMDETIHCCSTTKPQLFQTEICIEILKNDEKGKNEMNLYSPLSCFFFLASSKVKDLKAHMRWPSVFKVAFVYSHLIYIQFDKNPSSFTLLHCVTCRLQTVRYALDLVIA